MLTSRDVGQRISVRRAVEGGLTDVLGHLLSIDAGELEVLVRGAVVRLPAAAVTAARVVPPATPRRGWSVPSVSPAQMQRICWAGWPARETSSVGEWVLRAHGGITGRANSAMAVGSPGMAVPAALDAVVSWYAERGLPPLLQLPLVDPANAEMDAAGWPRLHVTVVQVAPIAPLLVKLGPPPRAVRTDTGRSGVPAGPDALTGTVESTPSMEWRSLMHDLDANDAESHLAILTGPPVVGFATVHRGDEPVGIGRVSVEGPWAGVTSVDVAPSARRQGIGSAVMATLLMWAQGHGALTSYLQVRAGNAAALRLYDSLGYVTHHPYGYRAPA